MVNSDKPAKKDDTIKLTDKTGTTEDVWKFYDDDALAEVCHCDVGRQDHEESSYDYQWNYQWK